MGFIKQFASIFPLILYGSNSVTHKRREFIFKNVSEFNFYKILMDLFGDQYYIFPQVHYIHLVEPSKTISEWARMTLKWRIDRRSADYVLCDKNKVIPRLVIELDGSSHNRIDRKVRDEMIKRLAGDVGLPILNLPLGKFGKGEIRKIVAEKLQNKSETKK